MVEGLSADMKSHVLVIAEAGVNHNGDIGLAKELITAAADAGADMVKFQTFQANKVATPYAELAEYQKAGHMMCSQVDVLSRLELSIEMHQEVVQFCSGAGIQFFSTAFDEPSLDFLYSLSLPVFKIPSGELTNLPYLRHVASFNRPLILSTGMASLGEIESALNVLERSGVGRKSITILHCNTHYPTPMCDVNLRAMLSIRDAFKVDVGYSDHTLGIEIPIAAVALGARVIEKHLTLDRNLEGPDHSASIEPHEFREMVVAVRNVEIALGDGIKKASASEEENIEIVRRSIVAKKRIEKGQLIKESDLSVLRPGRGISPMRWDEVIGTSAIRDFAPGEFIVL